MPLYFPGSLALTGGTLTGNLLSTAGFASMASYGNGANGTSGLSQGLSFSGTTTYIVGGGTGGVVQLRDSAGTMYLVAGDGYLRGQAKTVATLPAAATAGAGARSYVTDANATAFNGIVASGGANGVPVYSDGTNWRIG
jgi:hypothetical protein